MKKYEIKAYFTSNKEEKFPILVSDEKLSVSHKKDFIPLYVSKDIETANELMEGVSHSLRKSSFDVLLIDGESGWFDVDLIEDGKVIKNDSFFKTEDD